MIKHDKMTTRLIRKSNLPVPIAKLPPALVKEQRRYFNELRTKGTAVCRATGVRENLLIRNFNGEMAVLLYKGYEWQRKHRGKPFSTRDLAPKGTTKASTDGTYCLHLGLIEVVRKEGRYTYYSLTEKGEAAVLGEAMVPIEFVVFRGEFIQSSGKYTWLDKLVYAKAKQKKVRIK